MNIRLASRTAMVIAILLSACSVVFAQTVPASNAPAKPGGKELFIPARITRVPATNDFNHPDMNWPTPFRPSAVLTAPPRSPAAPLAK